MTAAAVRLLLALALAVLSGVAGAQDDYPDFIGRAGADEPTTSTLAAEPAEILVGDIQSSTTWFRVRERLPARLDQLRELLLTGAAPEELGLRAADLRRELGWIADAAPFQAPVQQEAVLAGTRRAESILRLLERDHRESARDRLQTTDELLGRALGELEAVMRESDLDRGISPDEATSIPGDWNPRGFRSPGFAAEIAAWNPGELLDAYNDRLLLAESRLRKRRLDLEPELASEMGELARELAGRLYSVPPTSRSAFRNACLRLDVIAENLGDYLAEGNLLYARRQARVARKAAEDARVFLAIKPG